MDAELFPDLAAERARLAMSRAARDRMIERLSALDPSAAADEITREYIEVTVGEALLDLSGPGAGDFFGRIDESGPNGTLDTWYIGRRHVEDDDHDPVVVDWRAPIAAPFYRATAVDPLGVDFRRRYTLDDEGEMTAYLDERLDDPDSGANAAGIPDPVLAEIGAERSGEMREIVATIQGEQDVVIRSDIDQILVVQGGPGTGKTAVALHRAAYLLFEHRARLARDGVLVVGPNRAFLDYIANVLPSLGERTVRQGTVDDLCIPRVEVTGHDDAATARWKGSAERLVDLEAAALAAITPPEDDIVVPIGVRNHVIGAEEFAGWIETALSGKLPVNQRRERLTAIARRELLRRSGRDDAWKSAGPLKSAITKAWPTQKPVKLVDRLLPGPSGKRRAWTRADQLLVDEANSLLDGTPFSYGHVVVDEAQDHSAVALRVIGRRSPTNSMTLVGDVAQSTAPAGQERWSDVFVHLAPGQDAGDATGMVADLTIGYRVPDPVLRVANRLLPLTGVDATASRSVRTSGEPPIWVTSKSDGLSTTVASETAESKRRHRLTGVVAPRRLHPAIVDALARVDLVGVGHVHDLGPRDVPLFEAHAVKGLEFDGVVVVNPHEILATDDGSAEDGSQDGGSVAEGSAAGGHAGAVTPLGARLLYVAMTRAVQRLVVVTDSPAPSVLG